MLAIIHKRRDTIARIMECVTNYKCMNLTNISGQTVLHLAVLVDLPQVVRAVVAHGGDVTALDKRGNTPLHLACQHGYHECVKALTTPLRYDETQARRYHIPYIRIPQNCDVRNYSGQSCLQLAASGNHYRVMRHLVKHCNADINVCDWSSGNTLLHQAIQENNESLCNFLLSFGMLNINAVRYDGLTPLALARAAGRKALATALHTSGAFETSPQTLHVDDVTVDCYDDFKIDGTYIRA